MTSVPAALTEVFHNVYNSHPGKLHTNPLLVKPDSNALELTSPRLKPENHGIMRQGGHAFQSNWAHFGHSGMPEVRSRSPEAFFVDPSHGGSFCYIIYLCAQDGSIY